MTEHKQNWEEEFNMKLEKFQKDRNYLGMLQTGQNQYDEGSKVWNEYQVNIGIAEKQYKESEKEIKEFIRQELQSTRTATIQECIKALKVLEENASYIDGVDDVVIKLSDVEQSLKQLL